MRRLLAPVVAGAVLALGAPSQAGDIADLRWQVSEHAPQPRLSILLPRFAVWSRRGLEQPVTIRIAANYLAFIDQWQVTLYRDGDTARSFALARYRGGPLDMARPLVWEGQVREGPALRPGESVIAELQVRDAAGNVDRLVSGPMLVSRTLMTRERRAAAADFRAREAGFADGEVPQGASIPVRGGQLGFVAKTASGGDAPDLAGLAMSPAAGSTWRARQILPPGRFTLPFGTGGEATVAIPDAKPLIAKVKGTGAMVRVNTPDGAPPAGYEAEGMVAGDSALGAVLLPDALSGEAPLALALVDPAARVQVLRDGRQRFLGVPLRPETALWPARPAGAHPVGEPALRSVAARFRAEPHPFLVLPDTDILPGSLTLRLIGNGETATLLVPALHYATEFAEGRILLSEAGRDAIADSLERQEALELVARYDVFGAIRNSPGATGLIENAGAMLMTTNGVKAGLDHVFAPEKAPPQVPWHVRLLRWLRGA